MEGTEETELGCLVLELEQLGTKLNGSFLLNIRKHFFAVRVIEHLQSLAREV